MKHIIRHVLILIACVLCGCTEDKTEQELIYQPSSFNIGTDGDDIFALKLPTGSLIDINSQPVKVLSRGLVSLYDVPAVAEYTVCYPSGMTVTDGKLSFDIPSVQKYTPGGIDVSACPYYSVTDNQGLDSMKLKPSMGALCLTIPANTDQGLVKEVTVESETAGLSGKATVDLASGVTEMTGEASRTSKIAGSIDITKECTVALAVPPTELTGKLDVTLSTGKGIGTCTVDMTGTKIEQGKAVSVALEGIEWKMQTFYYGKANSVIVKPGQTSVTVDCSAYYTTSPVYAYENHVADESRLPRSAAQVWNDTGSDFVRGVTLAPDRKSFTVSLDGSKGNSVIAIYDKEDPSDKDAKVLWSFHIWVTDVNEQSLGTNVNGNSYVVLDRNLGATSVTQSDTRSIGLLYQWGRKDPFVSTGEYGKNGNAKMYNEAGEVKFKSVNGGSTTGTVNYSIAHPDEFIKYSRSKSNTSTQPYYYSYDWLYNCDDALWGNPKGYEYPKQGEIVKSIYDPSPEGYMVAPNDTWLGNAEGSGTAASVFATARWDDGFIVDRGSEQWWYPIGGWRSRKTGSLADADAKGYYWCSSKDKEVSANVRHLTLAKSGAIVTTANCRANSCLIRCVKIGK